MWAHSCGAGAVAEVTTVAGVTAATGDGTPEPAGTLTIEDRVIEQIAARAALDIPGVTRYQGNVGSLLGSSAGRSIIGSDLPSAHVRSSGPAARISLDLALEWPCRVADIARQARDHVTDEVARLTGVRPVRVDVTVGQLVPGSDVRRRNSGFIDLPAAPRETASASAGASAGAGTGTIHETEVPS
ncbi:Asp23/Gls24 family envelope stress response protein [Gordonia jinghuaiqii]|uniref:Asp23/Gls24 family envelope stress response protein n=1 Tax=Gordonia jinghuaiqii TaxID=2758710 RepID=A0A7D7LPP5_9ACTN|nr:Asp23/Gls24 family envelope stress response protein [Gordonia jinghuaiqii]QMT00240.1 Asp23/Gls24 family envelope stress response protein [Gordonia jinghuaiqii]